MYVLQEMEEIFCLGVSRGKEREKERRERRKEGAEANVRRLRARNLMCAFRRYDAVAEAFLSADFCTSRFGKTSKTTKITSVKFLLHAFHVTFD